MNAANIKHRMLSILNNALARKDRASIVHKTTQLNRFSVLSRSSISKYTYIGPRTRIIDADIGSFCSISWDCQIGLPSHETGQVSTSPIFTKRLNGTNVSWVERDTHQTILPRTTIGSDVWIGTHAIVMAGVTVGHGAVIGAGSIVTKDVAPYTIVAGVPAKELRMRFKSEFVQVLLEKRWWEAPDKEIRDALRLFQSEPLTLPLIQKLPQGLQSA